MLAANVCAAQFLSENEAPALYRVHAGPSPEKLLALRQFLFELGLKLGGGDEPHARDYGRLLASLPEGPEGRLINTMLLRSLAQAVYSPDNVGHFALAYPTYTHFTSPIRRYPDLVVHRAIKGLLKAGAQPQADMAVLGDQCSMTERRADEATRDVIRWLKTEYMMDKVGETFDGIISGVTNFGLFVELAEIFVDGLVHISSLGDDYFHFDPAKQRLIGDRTNRTYRLGDAVKVRLLRADLDDAKLDFELVEDRPAKTARAPRQDKGPRQGQGHARSGRKKRKPRR